MDPPSRRRSNSAANLPVKLRPRGPVKPCSSMCRNGSLGPGWSLVTESPCSAESTPANAWTRTIHSCLSGGDQPETAMSLEYDAEEVGGAVDSKIVHARGSQQPVVCCSAYGGRVAFAGPKNG